MTARVLARTGDRMVHAEASATTVQEGDAFRVHVVLGGGARDVVASTCDLAASAAATVIALALVPDASPSRTESAGPPATPQAATSTAATTAPTAAPPPSARDVIAPPAASTRASSHRSLFAVGLFGAVDVGTLPGPGAGGGGVLALTPGRFRFEAELATWLTHDAEATDPTNGAPEGGAFHLVSGAARGCFALLDARVALGPCVGLGVDVLRGEGSGVTRTREGSSTFLAPSVGLLGDVRLARHVGLRALVEGAMPLTRQDFVIVGGSSIHRPGLVALRVAVGPEVTF